MASVFFSYSHKDEDLRNELEVHLSGLKRQGVISTWHDRRITAGTELGSAIDAKFKFGGRHSPPRQSRFHQFGLLLRKGDGASYGATRERSGKGHPGHPADPVTGMACLLGNCWRLPLMVSRLQSGPIEMKHF